MFSNHIKTAFRNLSKNKGFTLLNVCGLTLGLTVFLLIVFYVLDEIGYDRFNTKADRIFRVNTDIKTGNVSSSRAIAAPVIAQALASHFPEVEKTVRLLPDEELVRKGNEFIREDKAVYCDSTLFDVFTLPMMEGNAATALSAPNSVVISESAALKYFNKTNVTGRTLIFFGDSTVHTVTGVIHDVPLQSHFHFDLFLSMRSVQVSHNDAFNAIFPFSTYVLLKPGTDYKRLEAKFPALLRQRLDYYDDMEKSGDYLKINLTPLKDIHLQSNRTNELGTNGSLQYIYIFSAIALLVLLMACINFMNLSTARSANRAREVGVRKVLGSTRKNLIGQFLAESFMVTFAAALLAAAAAWALLPGFNQLSGKQLLITWQTFKWLLPALAGISLVVGAVAGAYPAFFLSAFRPIHVLKGRMATGFRDSRLRSMMVVFQFSASIFLIIGTLVIYNQLHYIQNKSLGFNRNQVLVVKHMNELEGDGSKVLQEEVKQLPAVREASLGSFFPTGNRSWINFLSAGENGLQVQFWPVDGNYIPALGMEMAKGRNFSNKLATDSSAMIINETAAKMMGFVNDPLNRAVVIEGMNYKIIGVVKDFNFSSLRDNINPLAMVLMTAAIKKYEGDGPDNLIIRINTGNIQALLNRVENKWKALSGNQHFDYSFMDEDFDAIYRTEQRMGQLFVLFTSLTIIIACLGLFGLAAYAAEQRTREISIRKVLGAEVAAIAAMLSKDFIKLVIISIFIAIPAAWFTMQKWLQGFVYRINIHWWIPVLAAFTAIIIAIITISFQSIKAAHTNPVRHLRSE